MDPGQIKGIDHRYIYHVTIRRKWTLVIGCVQTVFCADPYTPHERNDCLGMKMSDGRKTRGKIGQKNEKAKLDKEWNQVRYERRRLKTKAQSLGVKMSLKKGR